jgi:hypothetical protein
MALMRHRGDIAAPRAIGTGPGAGLRRKLRWPVRTYCCGSSAIPGGRFISDYIPDERFISDYQAAGDAIRITQNPRHCVLLVGSIQKAALNSADTGRYAFIDRQVNFLAGQGSATTAHAFVSRCPHGGFPHVESSRHWLPGSGAGIIVAITDLTARQGCN